MLKQPATTTNAVDTTESNNTQNRQQTIADDSTNDAKDTDVSSTMSLALQSVEEGRNHTTNNNTDDTDPSSQEHKMNVTEHSSDSSQPHPQQQSLSSPTDESLEHDENKSSKATTMLTKLWATIQPFWVAIKQTTTSPGFVAMVLAFITACIPPLQSALFEPGGALRFFGSAMEALGTASSPISTIVVAASLVPATPLLLQDNTNSDNDQHNTPADETDDDEQQSSPIIDERPGMTDPNFGPYQRPRHRRRGRRDSRFSGLRQSMRSSSMRILQAIPRSTPEMRRLHLWFNISRLFVTPAVIVGLILAFDCTSSNVLSHAGLAPSPPCSQQVCRWLSLLIQWQGRQATQFTSMPLKRFNAKLAREAA